MIRFHASELEYSKPKKNVMGGQTVVLRFEKTIPTLIVKKTQIVKVDFQQHAVTFSLSNKDLIFFNDLDRITLDMAFANAIEWFGKEASIDTIKSLFVPSLQKHELKTKTANIDLFNICNDRIHSQELTEIMRRNIDIVVEVVGVYFIPGQFGISYKTKQIKILPKYNLSSYSFIDDNDSDFSDAEPN
jgi:hypothetical protein